MKSLQGLGCLNCALSVTAVVAAPPPATAVDEDSGVLSFAFLFALNLTTLSDFLAFFFLFSP